MRTRGERISAQHDAWMLLGCLVTTRDDVRAELRRYRYRVQDQAPARVKIALACANDGLRPSAALKLLNQTIEDVQEAGR